MDGGHWCSHIKIQFGKEAVAEAGPFQPHRTCASPPHTGHSDRAQEQADAPGSTRPTACHTGGQPSPCPQLSCWCSSPPGTRSKGHFESLHATRKKINFNAQRRKLLQQKVTDHYKSPYCFGALDREKMPQSEVRMVLGLKQALLPKNHVRVPRGQDHTKKAVSLCMEDCGKIPHFGSCHVRQDISFSSEF